MHYGIGARAGKRSLNLHAVGQIAPNEFRPGIDCASMALAQVIEDGNLVTFIQQKLRANAPDVARPPGKENSHGRGKCAGLALNQSEVWAREDSATVLPFFF